MSEKIDKKKRVIENQEFAHPAPQKVTTTTFML